MWSSMKQISKEYRRSCKLINDKIDELKHEKLRLEKELSSTKKDDREALEFHIKDIEYRLKPLSAIVRDLNEAGRECGHYYDRGWWRSGYYTFNPNKSKQSIYAGQP